MTKLVSKSAQKAANHEALVARCRVAMREAEEAAVAAYEKFAKTAPRTPEGHIRDSCGGAHVYAYKPTYNFRKAMTELNAMERWGSGKWSIGNFWGAVKDQSITAAEVACNAARDVLQKHFPEEKIESSSWVD